MEAIRKEAATEVTAPPTENSIPPYRGKVKLFAYAAEKGITFTELADTARNAGYPKCSKAAMSLAARSEETGVQLYTPVFEKLYAAYGEPNGRRRDFRTKPCRLTVRLTESEMERFNAARGASTAQDFLHDIVMEAIYVRTDA